MSRIAGLRWCAMSLVTLIGTTAQAQIAAGRTEGEAGVTATGSARYTVPLALPPGTNGLVPSLAISYDSRGGNGLLGVGFRLAGLSIIRRCSSTLAQDGRIGAVALDWSDRYCLDDRRLRLTAGTYGVAGSQYQTEVETFVRVTALGAAGAGPASFRVERRDGLIYEYGTTADSRVESAGSDTPLAWAVSRIRDRDGNYLDVVYAEDAGNGSHRPVRIDYTGNLATGAIPYYSVRFNYEPRAQLDVPVTYRAGGPLSEPLRLHRIDVVHVATGRSLRSIELAYATPGATGRNRIGSLQECAATTCLPPTVFSWTAVGAGWTVNMSAPIPLAQYPTAIPGDIDGDGFDDLAYQDPVSRSWMVVRGSAYGFQSQAVNTGLGTDSDGSQALSVDVDGDGRRDILVPGGGNYWHRLRWTAGTFAYNATGVINPAPPGGVVAIDVDGDGRDDLVYVKSAGDAIYWRRNQTLNYSSYAAEAILWSVPAGTRLTAAPFVETTQRFRSLVRSGDFNGDGRVDLLVRTQQGTCGATSTCPTWVNRWLVLASNGAALEQQYSFDGNVESLLADFNGDATTDIGYWSTGGRWQLLLGSGSRGSALATFAGPFDTDASAPASTGRAMIVDWDADGRGDVLQMSESGDLYFCRSTGRSLQQCQPSGIAPGTVPGEPMVLDVNGDGFTDLTYSTSSVRLHLHQQVPPDALVSVTDGLGQRTDFEYQPLSNTAVHRVAAGSVYPVRDYLRPGFVVSRFGEANGSRQQTYFYEGGKVDQRGRGFLGFSRTTVTPTDSRPMRVTEYLQDPGAFERIGAPSSITLQQRSRLPLQRTTFAWARLTFGAGYEARAFAYPSSVTVDRFELDGVRIASAVTTTTMDAWGTPVRRQETTTELAKGSNPYAQHIETTTLGGVISDTTNWCLGRPATTQLTRQHSLPGGSAITRTTGIGWDFEKCRRAQEIVEPSSATLRVTTDFAYDAYGNLASETVTPIDQPPRVDAYSWTTDGRFPETHTNSEGHVEVVTWDPAVARPATVTDPNGLRTTFLYDDLGRSSGQVRPDGSSTTISRSRCGSGCIWWGASHVVNTVERGVDDIALRSAETGFDGDGRPVYVRREQPGGGQVFQVFSYDSRGLLTRESVPGPCCATPSRWVVHSYDVLGRRTSSERPASSSGTGQAVIRWRHDGHSVTAIDPLGRGTTRRHDALGRVIQVVDPALTDVDYEYDAFDNLVRVRDFSGAETVVTFDVSGLRRSIADPNAGSWSFDYLASGELKSQRNPRGQVISYEYDRLSRPVSRNEAEGTTTWSWGTSVAGRNVGSLAAVSSPGFQESYAYDSLGRLSAVTTMVGSVALQTSQSYDSVTGLPDVLTYPAGTGVPPLKIRRHYDRGRLVRVSDADDGTSFWQLDLVDSRGLPTVETLGNGVRVESTYDAVTGQIASRIAGPGGGVGYQNTGFGWDPAGNLTLREDRNRRIQERFFYDSRDRLDYVTRSGSIVLDLAYDNVGNLIFKSDIGTYRYDTIRRQQVIAAGPNTYSYDANGAMVAANGTAIGWTSFDLPSQISHPGGNYASFSYGPERSRYRQVARAADVTTETIYAADGLYERVTAGGTTSHRYYVVADGRRVAVQTRKEGAAPSTVYLLEDHLGGVDGLVAASGELLADMSYHSFGARRSGDGLSGSPSANEWQQILASTPRGYVDQEHLDNLGLIHMNGRVYDPVLGRFLSPDPIVQAPYDPQALNRYSYVRNNPLRYTDPSGFCFNTHPAADHLAQQCMEEIISQASRMLSDFSWIGDFAGAAELQNRLANAENVAAGGTPSIGWEELIVSGQRMPASPSLPIDMQVFSAYTMAQARLIDRMMEASTILGENAVNYYVEKERDSGNAIYRVPGALAALWTPQTAPYTSLVLGMGSALGRWSARPYWQYYPVGKRDYRSTWLTRGAGFAPPYKTGSDAAAMLSLPAYNPGTAVRAVYPPWYEYVRGPRIVEPQPSFGPHAVGGGLEYRMIPFGE